MTTAWSILWNFMPLWLFGACVVALTWLADWGVSEWIRKSLMVAAWIGVILTCCWGLSSVHNAMVDKDAYDRLDDAAKREIVLRDRLLFTCDKLIERGDPPRFCYP